jgi:hypothetical protein
VHLLIVNYLLPIRKYFYFAFQTPALEYLFFAAYLVLFAWLVTKIKFFNRTNLNNSQLIILFLLKVLAGIFYGWIGIYYGTHAQMQDTWRFHHDSVQEYNLIFTDPHEYFVNLFRDPYNGGVMKFFEGKDSYWNDLKGNFFVKILSIFNIFSFGRYFINVIFYSFITLFGPIAIYRVMTDVFPGKKIQAIVATFLIPSFLYWSSGLHKEGLIFLGFALVTYYVYFGLKKNRFSIASILFILLGMLLVLILRNFLIVILVPAVLTWILAAKFAKRPLLVFAACYTMFLVVFFTAKIFNSDLDFPQAVVTKQNEFTALHGSSSVPMRKLEPNFQSFMMNGPQAISLSIIRPYPGDVHHILSLAAATEINFLLLVFIAFLFLRKNGSRSRVFIYFCLFFSFSVLMAIGYSVNNLGAIVRYRSIILPFLMVPLFCNIDWDRIFSFVSNIMNKNNVAEKAKVIA